MNVSTLEDCRAKQRRGRAKQTVNPFFCCGIPRTTRPQYTRVHDEFVHVGGLRSTAQHREAVHTQAEGLVLCCGVPGSARPQYTILHALVHWSTSTHHIKAPLYTQVHAPSSPEYTLRGH